MSAMDERTDVRSRTRAGLARLAGPWWMFLLTGIGWLILAWIALRFAPASIPTVGVLLGIYFLVATINEFFIASAGARRQRHWAVHLDPAGRSRRGTGKARQHGGGDQIPARSVQGTGLPSRRAPASGALRAAP